MNAWTVTGIIEIGCITIMVLITIEVMIHRIVLRKGLGARAIQFLSVGYIVPTILILALEKIMSAEPTAALLGVLSGYLLSDIGKYQPKDAYEKTETKKESGQPTID
jgi:hypothetical protein